MPPPLIIPPPPPLPLLPAPAPLQVEEPLLEYRAESAAGSVIAALAFGAGVWGVLGADKGAEYFAGYLLEQSLSGALRCAGQGGGEACNWAEQGGALVHACSTEGRPPRLPTLSPPARPACTTPTPLPSCAAAVDNLFVFILVFSYFKTPIRLQSKVLTYGIATAAVLRLVLIVAGVDIGARRSGVAAGAAAGQVGPRGELGTQGGWRAADGRCLPACAPAVERFEPVLLLFAGILLISSAKLLL